MIDFGGTVDMASREYLTEIRETIYFLVSPFQRDRSRSFTDLSN